MWHGLRNLQSQLAWHASLGVAVAAHENTLLLLFRRARIIIQRAQMQRPSDWVDDPLLTSHESLFTSHIRLVRPSVSQQAVHEQLERVIKHDRQKNQTQIRARAENQDR